MRAVEKREEFVNVGVKDGLADETEGAVTDGEGFCETFGADSGDSLEHFDFAVMAFDDAAEDDFGAVDLPAPGGANGVGAVAPAEDALVGAGERGGGFHTQVGPDAVETVLVAGTAAAEGGFGPAADFDSRVGTDNGVALFRESRVGDGISGNHLLAEVGLAFAGFESETACGSGEING